MKINDEFLARMREAAQLLQTDGPMAATAAIQRALHGETVAENVAETQTPQAEVRDINPAPAYQAPLNDLAERFRSPSAGQTSHHWRSALQQSIDDVDAVMPARPLEQVAGKGRFLSLSCTNQAGTRAYKLYIPGGYAGESLPLIVMLHGCTQNPDDFAAGTGMNGLAEQGNCFVVYPAQEKSANGSGCWNWFQPSDQQRDRGEPSIIADITRAVIRDYRVDTRRIYVAGLSAGGAMATVMGAAYPELYAAIGVHSGLPYAVAHDMPSAFSVMKRRRVKSAMQRVGGRAALPLEKPVPVIVFHGDRDATVHPSNGDSVLVQCQPVAASDDASVEQGAVSGRTYTRTIHRDGSGKAVAEKWIVHGAGHAWSGGSSKGSYTDAQGPDASREMLRFFLAHAHEAR